MIEGGRVWGEETTNEAELEDVFSGRAWNVCQRNPHLFSEGMPMQLGSQMKL